MQEIILGDCFKKMANIPDKSINLILTDPPFNLTSCDWDVEINFEKLWKEYHRIIKDNCAILIFGIEPFSSYLRISNIKEFKYDWIWHKSKCGSAFTSKYRPQQKHEIISVFGKGRVNYYPIMIIGDPYSRVRKSNKDGAKPNNHKLGVVSDSKTVNIGFRYPETVVNFQQKWRRQDQLHPTQKPVGLCEYLIKTYTKENDIVLDSFAGSGTTGLAAKNLNRQFICIEKDLKFYNICLNRINHE